MKPTRFLAAALGIACAASSATFSSAQTTTCKTTYVSVPGSGGTIANGVNKYDTVVGEYLDNSSYHLYAFRWTSGHLSTYKYPGSNGTQFNGINDSGLIVGGTSGSPGNPATSFGLTYQKGIVHTFSYPGATETVAFGVNNLETIVGAYKVPGGKPSPVNVVPWNGYIKRGLTFTELIYPGAYATYARAISDNGVVVGSWFTATGVEHGFVYANGKYQAVNYPGANSTEVNGLNKYGALVGNFRPTSGAGLQGWGYRNGRFYKTAASAELNGINNLGDRVGAEGSSNPTRGTLILCR